MGKEDFVIEDDLGVIESPEDNEGIKEDISIEEVEEIDLGTVSDTDKKESICTEIIEQIEEDLGTDNIGGLEEELREQERIQKEQEIEEEVEIRATDRASVIVNEKIRSATEVLNEQNRLATREAEISIQERQVKLEEKIKRNKRKEKVGKVKTVVYGAIIFFLIYLFYSNPTLNSGVRTVVSNTLDMFSDLVAGEEVDSNQVINSIGTQLNDRNMKYVEIEVEEEEIEENQEEKGDE